MSSAATSADPAAAAAAAAAQQAAAAAMLQFTIEAWTLLSIGIVVTMLRTYARIKAVGFKGLQADDYLVWIGAIFYAIETSLAYSVGHVAQGLANNGMTDAQRAALSPDSAEFKTRVIGSKIQLAGWSSYSVLLWSLKASLLVFYMRLTAGLKKTYLIRIYIGFGLLGASFVTILMNLFLACRPFHLYWQINPDPGNTCQPAISNQIIWVYLSMNVITDLYLISIPVPMLWQSSLRPVKKFGLILLFSGGLFVVACAILRCALIVTDPVNGAQLAGSWAVRETFVAVITTNLPMVFPLIKTWLSPVFGSLLTTMRSQQKLTDKESKSDLRTFGGGSHNTWRRRGGPPTANPITNITFNESEERMVDDVKMQDLKGWTDTSTNGSSPAPNNNIRKHVEVEVVSEMRDESDLPDNRHVVGDEENQHHGNFSFARGPRRSSYTGQGRM
ncbi:uncharacterized protein F4807DRAFT_452868 [Annulohypoxylon truncatum]|uniref:uncharacterized protein n=1 Tax=Annulohypoxylon truncatum TaxID=327061 RepID=UPI0020077AF9|nr:uncharacterized protein F4807DRAFT_452868 [Annulohypoxylon truncatum]KAI1207526.1 hypothetical protein F4807DRAFT_452868 [Annulohypoxylon truncatum]